VRRDIKALLLKEYVETWITLEGSCPASKTWQIRQQVCAWTRLQRSQPQIDETLLETLKVQANDEHVDAEQDATSEASASNSRFCPDRST